MADITTIKVTKPLRDRITSGAAKRDQTVQNFIEYVIDEHERRERLAAVGRAISATPEAARQQWRAESEGWAVLDGDLDGGR